MNYEIIWPCQVRPSYLRSCPKQTLLILDKIDINNFYSICSQCYCRSCFNLISTVIAILFLLCRMIFQLYLQHIELVGILPVGSILQFQQTQFRL